MPTRTAPWARPELADAIAAYVTEPPTPCVLSADLWRAFTAFLFAGKDAPLCRLGSSPSSAIILHRAFADEFSSTPSTAPKGIP
jgi:hypothetical protein